MPTRRDALCRGLFFGPGWSARSRLPALGCPVSITCRLARDRHPSPGQKEDPGRLSASAIRVCMPCGCAFSLRKEHAIRFCGPVSGERPCGSLPVSGTNQRKEGANMLFFRSLGARTPIRTLHPYFSAPSLKKHWSRIRIRLESACYAAGCVESLSPAFAVSGTGRSREATTESASTRATTPSDTGTGIL